MVLVLFFWVIWLEIRVRSMQYSIYEQRLKISYQAIQTKNKSLSDSELNALLDSDIRGNKT